MHCSCAWRWSSAWPPCGNSNKPADSQTPAPGTNTETPAPETETPGETEADPDAIEDS